MPTSSCRLKGGPHSYNNDTLCAALSGRRPGVCLFSLLWTFLKLAFLQMYYEPLNLNSKRPDKHYF